MIHVDERDDHIMITLRGDSEAGREQFHLYDDELDHVVDMLFAYAYDRAARLDAQGQALDDMFMDNDS